MTVQNPISQLAPMNPSDLNDMLADGPRGYVFSPSHDEMQEILAQIHDDMGDRNPEWSSDQEG
jgi:hypothetical protein